MFASYRGTFLPEGDGMNDDELTPLDRAVLEGRQYGVFDLHGDHRPHSPSDLALGRLLRNYELGVIDGPAAEMIMEPVKHYRRQFQLSGVPFPPPRLDEGDHIIGFTPHGRPLRGFRQSRSAHVLRVGGSKAGKTTHMHFDAVQLIPHVTGSWTIDPSKRGFRKLPGLLADAGVDMEIVPARRMKLNPLQPPFGVDAREWAARVSDMIIAVLCLPPRASKFVQAILHQLYRQCRVFEGSQNIPTLFDLREAAFRDTEANSPARLAIIDSLDPLLEAAGEIFKFHVGWSSHDLSQRHLIMELDGVTESTKNLIINTLLLSEFTSRVARGIANRNMDLVAFVDEAQRLAAVNGPNGTPGPMGDLICVSRGVGISLDLALQASNGMSPLILSNTATKVLGRCGSMADYSEIGGCMGLNSEQIRWAQLNLRPGLFICQLSEGRWRYPFVLQIPPLDISRDESGTLEQHTLPEATSPGAGTLWSLPTVPAIEYMNWPKEHTTAESIPVAASAAAPAEGLSEAEARFLKAVRDEPGCASSAYASIAGMGTKKAQAVRERLVAAGYLRVHEISSGKRGRMALVLEPIDRASQAATPASKGE
jgi:hypothetical protein